MKTLTITDARKNLGRWLEAASRGEDIGIISGADIIALRKVDVEATDYAFREYGLTPEEVAAYEAAAVSSHKRAKRAGKLQYLTSEDLKTRNAASPLTWSTNKPAGGGCARR